MHLDICAVESRSHLILTGPMRHIEIYSLGESIVVDMFTSGEQPTLNSWYTHDPKIEVEISTR